MTLTWRASKYKVHKLLKRYILLELVLLQTNPTTTGSSANQPYHNWFFANQPYHNWFFANQPYDSWLFSKPTLPHLGFFCKATLPHLVLCTPTLTTTGYLQTNSTTTGSLQTNPTTSGPLQIDPYHIWSFENQPYYSRFFCKPSLPQLVLLQTNPTTSCPLQINPTTTGSSVNQPYHNWLFANQPYHNWSFANQPYHNWSFANEPYHTWFFCKPNLSQLDLLQTNPTTTGSSAKPALTQLGSSAPPHPVLLQTNPTTTGSSANFFHLDVHHVCYIMLVQRFEPQGRRFTNFYY